MMSRSGGCVVELNSRTFYHFWRPLEPKHISNFLNFAIGNPNVKVSKRTIHRSLKCGKPWITINFRIHHVIANVSQARKRLHHTVRAGHIKFVAGLCFVVVFFAFGIFRNPGGWIEINLAIALAVDNVMLYVENKIWVQVVIFPNPEEEKNMSLGFENS